MHKVIFYLIIIFPSFLLTNLISYSTDITKIDYIFIFLYFFAIFFIIGNILFKKQLFTVDKKTLSKILILTLLFSILVSFCLPNFKSSGNLIQVTPIIEKNMDSKSNEIWISEIKFDDDIVDLTKLNISEPWKILDGNLVFPGGDDINVFYLPISKKYDNAQITFGKHDWSGIVELKYGSNSQKIDLYNNDFNNRYDYKIKTKTENITFFEKTLNFLGIFSIIYLFVLIFINTKIINYNQKRSLVILILYFYLFYFNRFLIFAKSTTVFFFIILFFYIVDLKNIVIFKDKVHFSLKHRILIGFVNFINSFCIFGDMIFFQGNINLEKILAFLAGYKLIKEITYYIIYFIDKKQRKYSTIEKNNIDSLLFYKLLIVFFLLFSIYLYAFNPILMSSDSMDQWNQARGLWQINNIHPIFSTLILKFLYNIYPHLIIVPLMQILIYSTIFAYLINYFHINGLDKSYIYVFIIALFFSYITPSFVITAWKDILFTASLLLLTHLLYYYKRNENENIKNRYYIYLFISLFGTVFIRFNGILGYYMLMLYFIGNFFKKLHNKQNLNNILKILTCFMLIFACLQFKNHGLYKYNIISPHKNTKYYAFIGNMIGVYLEKDLPNNEKEFIEYLAPKEVHKNIYSPFNMDRYAFGEGKEYQVDRKIKENPSNEIIKMYLNTFLHHPFTLIKYKLYNIELLWNVKMNPNSFEHNTLNSTEWVQETAKSFDINIYHKKNIFENILLFNKSIIDSVEILNFLIQRVGLYLILINLIFVYFIINNKAYTFIFIPVYGNIITYFLAGTHQSLRYYWFVQLICIYIFIASFFINNNVNKGG